MSDSVRHLLSTGQFALILQLQFFLFVSSVSSASIFLLCFDITFSMLSVLHEVNNDKPTRYLC